MNKGEIICGSAVEAGSLDSPHLTRHLPFAMDQRSQALSAVIFINHTHLPRVGCFTSRYKGYFAYVAFEVEQSMVIIRKVSA